MISLAHMRFPLHIDDDDIRMMMIMMIKKICACFEYQQLPSTLR